MALSGEHMMGTSIMAVSFDGGVVVGADSRTSTGSYIANRVSNKLTTLHDRIMCCRSGSAADTQAVADVVQVYLDMHAVEMGGLPQVRTAAMITRSFCYENKDNLLAGIIIGGWDPVHRGSVYSVTLGGSVVKQDFAIGGSGSTYIYAYCDANFKPGMSRAECQTFVRSGTSSGT
jgi:20S proteasome subunit beta 1